MYAYLHQLLLFSITCRTLARNANKLEPDNLLMRKLLCYTAGHSYLLGNTTHYVPEFEFLLLASSILELKSVVLSAGGANSDDTEGCVKSRQVNFINLVNALLLTANLVVIRDPTTLEEYSEKLSHVLEGIPNDLLENLVLPCKSRLCPRIVMQYPSIKREAAVLSGEDLLQKISVRFRTPISDESIYDKECLTVLISNIVAIKDNQDDLLRWIRVGCNNVTLFLENFFLALMNVHNHLCDKKNTYSTLGSIGYLFFMYLDNVCILTGASELDGTLESSISVEELANIFREINFHLSPKKSYGMDNIYALSSGLISILQSSKISNIFTENVQGTHRSLYRLKLSQILPSLNLTLIADELPLRDDLCIPLLLRGGMMMLPVAIREAAKSLLKKITIINETANQAQQYNIFQFFMFHQGKILQLIHVAGSNGIAFMRSYLGNSLLRLNGMLHSLSVLSMPVLDVLANWAASKNWTFKSHPEYFRDLHLVICTVSTCGFDEESCDELRLIANAAESPRDILDSLTRNILEKIFDNTSHYELSQVDISNLLSRIDIADFCRLANAANSMRNATYREVFLEMLACEILQNDVYCFLHDTEQGSTVGAALAKHNQMIRKELERHEISPETALEYSPTYDFYVIANQELQPGQANTYLTLWSYTRELTTALANMTLDYQRNIKLSHQIQAIQRYITQIQQNINKCAAVHGKEEAVYTVLSSQNMRPTLGKLNATLLALQTTDCILPQTVLEFGKHFTDTFATLSEGIASLGTKNVRHNSVYYFSVKQWDKCDFQTYFLGDSVGCCLATDSIMFPGLVPRRVDDTVLFHVAIDLATNKPAALIWLYLGILVDGSIALIANFFEVQAKYALNSVVRLALLNGLLYFTHQYCLANPNIRGFYMSPLEYGYNQSDLEEYEMVDMRVKDKLLGALVINEDEDEVDPAQVRKLAQKSYYLNSLNSSRFHLFSLETYTQSHSPKGTSVQKTITEGVRQAQMQSCEDVASSVARNNRLQLSKFFSTPLEEDVNFQHAVEEALETQRSLHSGT